MQYQVNINAFNVAINPIIMPPTDYSSYNTTLKGMQTCINVLVEIYTSAYFDMGLFTKALEITWAKPMYMKYIFLCEGGMHLLITGFVLGHVAQSVTCLATDACLTADPGVASSIPASIILSWRLIMK